MALRLLIGPGMKTSLLAASLFVALVSACSGGESSLPSKGDLAGKADQDSSEYCLAADLPEDCDLCEEMGWYGDGVCDTFCAKADPDCGPAIPAAISTQFAGGALPPIHPQLGVYAVVKPGVFAVVSHFANLSELTAEGNMVSWALAEPITCNLEVGTSTADPCNEEVQATGCFFGQGGTYNPVTKTLQALEEYEIITPTAEEKASAAALEGKIQFKVTSEGTGAEFYYGEIDGKLYLLAVDVATLDCSA
ncbi:MAG: hypothetical protein SFX73_25450 [Kofleriaceae bacterium]|nr:hypothetical protein [Kofleriaceae bacterium]